MSDSLSCLFYLILDSDLLKWKGELGLEMHSDDCHSSLELQLIIIFMID